MTMRILLAANASYDPPKGGSTRSNLKWLTHLASRGHACRVLSAGVATQRSVVNGIEIESVPDLARHSQRLDAAVQEFRPDWLLVSSEDLSHSLIRQAGHSLPGRLVYLAHTPQWYPFGPASWHQDAHASAVLRQAAGVVAIGHHMAGYIAEHLGRAAQVIHPPMYGVPPFPRYGRFGEGLVLMVNPCAVKGIAIFLELARRFPRLEFAALEGWGTTSEDRAALRALSNVTVLGTVRSIDEVLSRTQLLLMPSLWYEGFGLIAMEAMLRGLPVIASESGGLQEAKQGTRYVVPVRPIRAYRAEFDETHMPVPVVEEQDLQPWAEALGELTANRDAWQSESDRSRAAATQFVERLRVEEFEEFLTSLQPRPAGAPSESEKPRLTPAQKAALLAKVRALKTP